MEALLKLISLAAVALLAACASPSGGGSGEYVMSPQAFVALLQAQVDRYGREPVKACFFQAKAVPGDDYARLAVLNSCVSRLTPL